MIIPDPNFSIPDPGSKRFRILDPGSLIPYPAPKLKGTGSPIRNTAYSIGGYLPQDAGGGGEEGVTDV